VPYLNSIFRKIHSEFLCKSDRYILELFIANAPKTWDMYIINLDTIGQLALKIMGIA
jgi:hypothetical protein